MSNKVENIIISKYIPYHQPSAVALGWTLLLMKQVDWSVALSKMVTALQTAYFDLVMAYLIMKVLYEGFVAAVVLLVKPVEEEISN